MTLEKECYLFRFTVFLIPVEPRSQIRCFTRPNSLDLEGRGDPERTLKARKPAEREASIKSRISVISPPGSELIEIQGPIQGHFKGIPKRI